MTQQEIIRNMPMKLPKKGSYVFAFVKPHMSGDLAATTKLQTAIQAAGWNIRCISSIHPTKEQAEIHLQHLTGPVKQRNIESLIKGRILGMILTDGKPDAPKRFRKLLGPTEPSSAPHGTIRGDFSTDSYEACAKEQRALYNVMHASDTPEAAESEAKLWLSKLLSH